MARGYYAAIDTANNAGESMAFIEIMQGQVEGEVEGQVEGQVKTKNRRLLSGI